MSWFEVSPVADGVFVIKEPGHVQSYLVNGKTCSALLDTGMGFRDIRDALSPLLRERVIVLNTHWHFDHIGGNALFTEVGISALERHLIEPDLTNSTLMDMYLEFCLAQGVPLPAGFVPEEYEIQGVNPTFCIADGDEYDLGGRVLQAIATPGHTHGSTSFLDRLTGSFFCGDLAYQGEIYAHFSDSGVDAYIASLNRLMNRRDEFERIYPSHNAFPVPKAFLAAVLEGFRNISHGNLPTETVEDWGELANRYAFDGFSILTKSPGSDGVRLLHTS